MQEKKQHEDAGYQTPKKAKISYRPLLPAEFLEN